MENKIILDKMPFEYYDKPIGQGSYGRCYKVGNSVYKEFLTLETEIEDNMKRLLDLNIDSFAFPTQLVYLNQNDKIFFMGYFMKLIKGCELEVMGNKVRLSTVLNALRKFEKDLYTLSLKHIKTIDLNPYNVMFSTDNRFYAIDTDLYETSFIADKDVLKYNVKELNNMMVYTLMDLNKIQSREINNLIYKCVCEGYMYPSQMIYEILEMLKKYDMKPNTLEEFNKNILSLKKKN